VFNAYAARAFAPAWTTAAGELTPRLTTLLEQLDHAPEHGLSPRRISSAALRQEIALLTQAKTSRRVAIEGARAGRSHGERRAPPVRRRPARRGRWIRASSATRSTASDRRAEAGSLFEAALGAPPAELAGAIAAAEPRGFLYQRLVNDLAHYRALATQPNVVPVRGTGKIVPGDRHATIPALRTLLAALGDLPADAPPPPPKLANLYDHPLADAVRRFQARHGLPADAVIGAGTWSALAVPPEVRARQIALTIERLRWLPELGDAPFILVNVPSYRLWVIPSAITDGEPVLTMNVVVGQALDKQTPLLASELTNIVFRPYWNVPKSIAEKEIAPSLAKDPEYLAKNDMELVASWGSDAAVIPFAPERIPQLASGAIRVRQRPGPRNSLGAIKFVFPNDESVYLHGTPMQSLFKRSRRALSHGCVRVEDPVTLATYLLREEPAWAKEKIVAATSAATNRWVEIDPPMPVLLFYATALPRPDGTVAFADDIYGLDEPLAKALAL
jgi:murein L,D-transpeptidase YcbB/YkuD